MISGKKPKEPRRKVVREEYAGGNQHEVELSCGHVYYVGSFGRYAHCKTLSCWQCVKRENAS